MYVCNYVAIISWYYYVLSNIDSGYNLPKVTHCTSLLQEFVYGKKDIGNIPSESLPELVRQFLEDAYLCVYTNHDGMMH